MFANLSDGSSSTQVPAQHFLGLALPILIQYSKIHIVHETTRIADSKSVGIDSCQRRHSIFQQIFTRSGSRTPHLAILSHIVDAKFFERCPHCKSIVLVIHICNRRGPNGLLQQGLRVRRQVLGLEDNLTRFQIDHGRFSFPTPDGDNRMQRIDCHGSCNLIVLMLTFGIRNGGFSLFLVGGIGIELLDNFSIGVVDHRNVRQGIDNAHAVLRDGTHSQWFLLQSVFIVVIVKDVGIGM